MEASSIIYVIIMIFFGLFKLYKKSQQGEERNERRSFSENTPGRSDSPTKKLMESFQGTQPLERTPQGTQGRLQGQGAQGRLQQGRLQGQGAQGRLAKPTTPPAEGRLHPLDLQREHLGREVAQHETVHRETLREVPEITPILSEVVANETSQAQEFWNTSSGVGRVDSTKSVTTKARPALLQEMTPRTIAQGIVLAEILQPPRARRPYRPIYQERD